MKKLISMLLCVCISLTFVSVASAEDTTYIFELEALGILKDGYNLNQTITRAEAAMYFVRLLGMENVANQYYLTSVFQDVENDNPAKGSIQYLKEMGYISGISETEFGTDLLIDKNQAAAILIRILGYEKSAVLLGSYPENYLICAGRIGLFDKVNTGKENFVLDDFARMLYNALDIGMLIPRGYSSKDSFVVSNDETLRKRFEQINDELNFRSGVLAANYEMYTLRPIYDLEPDEVYIDNVIYKVDDNLNIEEYIGMKIDFYYYEKSNGDRIITKARLNGKVSYADIDLGDVTKLTQNSGSDVLYYLADKDSNRTRSIKVSNTASYLLNFDPITTNTDQLLLSGRGLSRFIDNDGDDIFDMVITKRYSVMPIKEVNYNKYNLTFVFRDGYTYNGNQTLTIDLSDDDHYCRISDKDGNVIQPDEINKDDVLSVIGNNAGTRYRMYISDAKIEGSLNRIDNEEGILTIADDNYKVCNGAKIDANLGRFVTAYLSHDGKIAFVREYKSSTEDGQNSYAVVIESKYSSRKDRAIIQIATASPVKKEKQENTNIDFTSIEEQATSMQLAARNSSLLKAACAEKVYIDNKKYTNHDAVSNLLTPETAIKYELNSDGEISRIDILLPNETGRLTVNASEMTFYGNAKFGIDPESTFAACFPSNTGISDLDYLAKVELKNGAAINVRSYDYNEDTHCANFFVVKEPLNYAVTGPIKNSSPVGIVTRSVTKLDEYDDICKGIIIETADGKKEYDISQDLPSYSVLENLKGGMFIAYALNTENSIGRYNLIEDLKNLGDYHIKTQNGYEIYYGIVQRVDYKEISDSAGRWVDKITVTDGNGGNYKTYELRRNDQPDIFIYKDSQAVEKANNNDVMPGNKVVIYSDAGYNAVLSVVVIK